MIDFSSVTLPKFNPEDFDNKVAERLYEIKDQPIPPVDVELIAERAGFNLIDIPGLKYISSTDAFLSTVEKSIYYDPDINQSRIRFSIAHELGHYDLHMDILKEVRFGSYDEWKTMIKSIPGWFWGTVETQANMYAGKLLVPRNYLIQSISEFKEELLLAQRIIPDDLNAIREYLAGPLARIFDVSPDMMRFRLDNEKINPYDFI